MIKAIVEQCKSKVNKKSKNIEDLPDSDSDSNSVSEERIILKMNQVESFFLNSYLAVP